MTSLTPSELADLRKMLDGVGLSAEKQDDMIRILDNIAKSWIDQAHGTHSVRLSLLARANYKFSGIDAYATKRLSKKIEMKPRESEVDSIITGPEGHLTP